MNYKHIIFDLDGTLINTERAVLNSLKETIKDVLNKDYSLSDLKFALGIPGDVVLEKLNIKNKEFAKEIWTTKIKQHYSKIALFPFIEEAVNSIKSQGIKVGILTSKTREEYIQDFLPFNISNLFEISLCIDDYHSPKPSSKGMLDYLKLAKIEPQEALYIGDTIYDYKCATGANVDFGLAVWGCNFFEGIQAKYNFNTPQDIIYDLEIKYENEDRLVKLGKELQFIGQVGETYTKDAFDLDRFKRIRGISAEILSIKSDISIEKVKDLFCNETGFQTPKLDVRGAIIKENKILLVQERNYTWSLPGGWVDVNDSIKTSVIKEVHEEAGLRVVPTKLIAIQDRNVHNSPKYAYGITKAFVLCEVIDGHFIENIETIKSAYFSIEDLPNLAEEKVNKSQIKMCLHAAKNEDWQTLFD